MRIVLDTSALFYPRALAALRDLEGAPEIVLPAIALMERARQLRSQGREGWLEMLRLAEASGWAVEPFGPAEVRQTVALAPLERSRWARVSRDAMLAGHLAPEDALWTAHPRDFVALGVPPERVVDAAAL